MPAGHRHKPPTTERRHAESSSPARARVFDLFVGRGAPTWGQIKQGPERLDRSEMARILSRIAWRIDQLACPVQADRAIAPSLEDGNDRNRMAIGAIAPIVAAEAIVGSRQQPDVLPPPVACERRDPCDRGLSDNCQIAAQPFKMGHRAVPSIDKRSAGRAWALLQSQFSGAPSRWARPRILHVPREHVMVKMSVSRPLNSPDIATVVKTPFSPMQSKR